MRIVLSLCGALAARAEIVDIECTADTTLHEHAEAANLGGHSHVAAGSTAVPSPSRGLFRFDLAGKLPANATIVSASFRAKVIFTPVNPAKNISYSLHRVLKSWGEGTGTGNLGRPALTGEASWTWRANPERWGQAGGEAGVDYTPVSSSSLTIGGIETYSFSGAALADDVKAWLETPNANFGWMLIADSEQAPQTARRFGSREGGAPAILRIEYTSSAPEFRFNSVQLQGTNVVLTWEGGAPPYQLQSRDNVETGNWANVGQPVTGTSAQIPADKRQTFFRVATGL